PVAPSRVEDWRSRPADGEGTPRAGGDKPLPYGRTLRCRSGWRQLGAHEVGTFLQRRVRRQLAADPLLQRDAELLGELGVPGLVDHRADRLGVGGLRLDDVRVGPLAPTLDDVR